MQSALSLTGIGLRTPHYSEFLQKQPPLAWVEVHSENYFGEGGRPLATLEKVRRHYPVSLHGVGLSLGSTDELNWQHLNKLKELARRIQPCLISEHLSFSSINGQYLHDLLPLPYTEEALQQVAERVQQIQQFLNCQIIIENISSYVRYAHSTLTEPEFLTALATKTGCGILLDVNNIYVSARNLGFEPIDYIAAIPAKLVQEIHLAGFTSMLIDNHEVLIDSHNRPIVPAVWDLYQKAIQHLGHKPTIIEWDADLPTLEALCLEAYRAEKIMRDCYAAAKRTG